MENALLTERQQVARWAQHFQEELNRPKTEYSPHPQPVDIEPLTDTNPPAEEEVRAVSSNS